MSFSLRHNAVAAAIATVVSLSPAVQAAHCDAAQQHGDVTVTVRVCRAVLIAGSNGFGNYRHQADVCHAYQILARNGVPDDHIITFFYDDIALDSSNPFPGQIFNKPADTTADAVDVYAGCKKSYTGLNVTAANVLAVLRGNASGVTGGSGEVLLSGPEDDVFINYVNHGATAMVGMPTGQFLYAYEIQDALQYMHDSRMFRKLVFYMEACESGSMFQDLPNNITVFAATAANADQPSWAGYCPPADMIGSAHVGSCLGDIFSTNWMENADLHAHQRMPSGHMNETLCEQFTVVQSETSTSHVCAFGDFHFMGSDIGAFQGNATGSGTHTRNASCPAVHSRDVKARSAPTGSITSRLATIESLRARLSTAAPGTLLQQSLHAQLMQEERMVSINTAAFDVLAQVQLRVPSADIALQLPVSVTQWRCYRSANDAMHTTACGRYTDYTLQFAHIVASLCELHLGDEAIVTRALHDACSAAVEDFSWT